MIRLNDIIDKVMSYMPDADPDVLRKAYVFSAKVHKGQERLSGEPYLTHPLEVASILAELNIDVPSVTTGFLHDTVEDTLTSLEEIEELFGPEVSQLVDGVTKISRMTFSSQQERQAENFRKMIIAMARDIRILLIKLADRLHNMRTIKYLPDERREAIAQETMDIYAHLANRLGIGWIRSELEDLSFMVLKPEIFSKISNEMESVSDEIDTYAKEVTGLIKDELKGQGIDATLQSRRKHIYGIYSKMIDQEIGFDEVYDIIAFRVIVGSLKECYGSLGIIHSLWKPVPGRFKDYVAMPKPNMYQSLHTTVIGPKGERIEIQIRTEEMHRIAEKGIAAHWLYKEGIKGKGGKTYDWLQRLNEWQHDLKDPDEFLKTVKVDLFPEEVFVFTPKGDVKALPKGATPIDFAYSVHTDIGNTCSRAKINGRLVPLRYQLVNGDIVEISTNSKQRPNKDWLHYVVTSKARQKIKHWLINEQRERSISLGREILEKEFKKHGMSLKKKLLSKDMKEVIGALKARDVDDLLSKVANARITTSQIIEFFIPREEIEKSQKKETTETRKRKKGTKAKTGVLVNGADDIMIRFAGCCNPLPGDQIVGFISRGTGLSIHNVDCPNVATLPTQRLLDVKWDVKDTKEYNTRITVLCNDNIGTLASIANAISSAKANISEAQIKTMDDSRARCEFELKIHDLNHLKRVIKSVEMEKDVISVQRIV